MNPTTPVTRSKVAWVAVVLWIALVAAIIGVGVVAGRMGEGSANLTSGGEPGAQGAVVTADPSASPSASTKPDKASKPGRDQRVNRGRDGIGAKGFALPRGAITITAINGTQLSLKTVDGWTRTIDAAGATIHNGREAGTLADLRVGDQIVFRQTRNANGTFTITDITIVQPQVSGTVASVSGSTFTVKLPDGTTRTVHTDSSTTYSLAGKKDATITALSAGLWVHVTGRRADDGTITATTVRVAPVIVAGQVTAKTATSITITEFRGMTVTVQVDAATTYQSRGNASASLADVTVGGWIAAQGALNADGSLRAATVNLFPGIKANGKGTPKGRGPFGGGPANVVPSAPPAATT